MAAPTNPSKERKSRIALDYYKRGDAIVVAKRALGLAGLGLACGWVAWGFFRGDVAQFSPGELAWAHATWDQQCSTCHVDFVAIRSDAALAKTPSVAGLADRQCRHCHAAPDHHATTSTHITSCASCHREHQGRNVSLVRSEDQSCTACHANLPAWAASSKTAPHVTSFDERNHPPFRSLASDPGKLKFSHQLHLTPGISFGPQQLDHNWTLNKLPASFREQYQPFADSAQQVLTLDCAACHQLDAPPDRAMVPGEAIAASPRSAGAYMLPVRYEQHCQACHPLTFEARVAEAPDDQADNVAPHRLSADDSRQFLERLYADRILERDPQLLDRLISPPSTLPNKPARADEVTVRELLDQSVRQAAAQLSQRCTGCHEMTPSAVEGAPSLAVVPVNVPHVWLQQGRFDHAAHSAIACRDCHSHPSLNGTRPTAAADLHDVDPQKLSWLDNFEVLVPGIEKCLECHSPRSSSMPPRGGARFDCAECHWYHGREALSPHALDRDGKATPAVSRPLNAASFLQGDASADAP